MGATDVKVIKNRHSQARRSHGEKRGLERRWPVTFESDFS
jgi:hypothetical protein